MSPARPRAWLAGPLAAGWLLLAGAPAGAGSLTGLYVAIHTMQPGESAASLGKTYGINRGTLAALNPAVDLDRLKPGDRVRIQSRPGAFQTLDAGLTLYDVALAYQVELDDLVEANEIRNPRRVPSGIELFIPGAEPLPDDRRSRLVRQQRQRRRSARAPRGAFGKPLAVTGRLVMSDGFGARINPITREPQHHTGSDLVAPYGTPILAARAGVVTWAGVKGGYGKLVILRHANGYETYYGHTTEYFVKEGDEVIEGQVIARVGMSGDATAPHLHFEVRYDGTPRNPQRYLAQYF